MRLSALALAVLALGWTWIAQAQLPPPSPEEAAKKQEAAQKKEREENSAKAALTRAQNRVVERYHAARRATHRKTGQDENAEPIPQSEASIEE